MEKCNVSLDFIDEAIRDKVTVLVGNKQNRDGSFDAEMYFDITSYISNLPEVIEKAEVKIEVVDCVFEGEFDDFEKEAIVNEIGSLLSDADALSKGCIHADATSVTLTLMGGVKITAWNSEWGGMSIQPPE